MLLRLFYSSYPSHFNNLKCIQTGVICLLYSLSENLFRFEIKTFFSSLESFSLLSITFSKIPAFARKEIDDIHVIFSFPLSRDFRALRVPSPYNSRYMYLVFAIPLTILY